MNRRKFIIATGGGLGAAMLPLTGCSNSGLITLLDVAEVACTAAVPIIDVFAGELGPLVGTFQTYISGISAACAKSVNELQNTADSPAAQKVAIAGYFAAVAVAALPPGIAAEASAAIGAIIAAVQLILSALKKAPVPAPAPAVKAKLTVYHAQVKALGSDKARMDDILSKHEQVKLKLAGKK